MSDKQTAILIGAAITGFFSVSFFALVNSFCCLGVIIGGIVATQQYVSRTGGVKVETGDAAIIGAGAGALGSVLGTLVDLALKPIGLDAQSVTQQIMGNVMENMQPGQSQQFQAMMQQQSEQSVAMLVVFSIIGIVVYAIAGAIGGAIGAAIFGGEEDR